MYQANKLFITLILLGCILIGVISGCNKRDLDSSLVGPGTETPELSLLIQDENQINISQIYIFQPVLIKILSTLSNPTWVVWNLNADSALADDTLSGSWQNTNMVSWQFRSAGTYRVTARVWYGNNQTMVISENFPILPNNPTTPPLIKNYTDFNHQLSNGQWEIKIGGYARAVKYANCSPTSPFFIFWDIAGGHVVPVPNPADTSDGYWKIILVVNSGQYLQFSFGGNYSTNCYAYIYPRPPFWSSSLLVYPNTDSTKLAGRVENGAGIVPGGPTGGAMEPGITGDSGPNATVRIGKSTVAPLSDSLVVYLRKAQVSATGTGFRVDDVVGLGTYQDLKETPNYSGWWRFAFRPDTYIPESHNNTIFFNYGVRNGSSITWANISNSFFYNMGNNYLEMNVQGIGDFIQIKYRIDGGEWNTVLLPKNEPPKGSM